MICLDHNRTAAPQPFPRQGEPCLVKITREGLPAAGIAVSVTYRPNSEVAITEEIGRTDARGELSWTPRSAGIGMLAAEGCDLTVSIRFRGIPIGGLVVMLLAAMILFGGNSYSFAKTFGRA